MGIGSGGAIEPKSMRWCSYSFMLTSRSSAYRSFQNAPPHSYHHTGGPSQRLGFPQQRQAGSSHWWCEVLRST